LPANSLATRSVAGKARSYSYGLSAETMTKAITSQASPKPEGVEQFGRFRRSLVLRGLLIPPDSALERRGPHSHGGPWERE